MQEPSLRRHILRVFFNSSLKNYFFFLRFKHSVRYFQVENGHCQMCTSMSVWVCVNSVDPCGMSDPGLYTWHPAGHQGNVPCKENTIVPWEWSHCWKPAVPSSHEGVSISIICEKAHLFFATPLEGGGLIIPMKTLSARSVCHNLCLTWTVRELLW